MATLTENIMERARALPEGTPLLAKELLHLGRRAAIDQSLRSEMFVKQYGEVYKGDAQWNSLPVPQGDLYHWDPLSTYVKHPPYFEGMTAEPPAIEPIRGARVLALLGDSVTTDHISPAGSIKKDSPAGRYLMEHGVQPLDFNSYGSRRGNDRVMTRGTFANIRLRNLLAPGTEGGVTVWLGKDLLPHQKPEQAVHASNDPKVGEILSIFDASLRYQQQHVPLIVLAGKDYGMGSSRDWAAKGVFLLGVKAVIAESFERIHRSNLVGMGVLPLQFKRGQTRTSLGLTGTGLFDIQIPPQITRQQPIHVTARYADGTPIDFDTICRIDTPVEVDYYRNGGILQTVLRRLLKGS